MNSPFLAMIQYFAFDFAPRGYAQCQGQLMSIQQNTALFALLGTTYGGNGIQTFALPDLRGRSTTGWGTNNSMGEKTGSEGATLLTTNMPTHTHTAAPQIAANISQAATNVADPTNAFPAGVHTGRGTGGLMYTATKDANTFLGAPQVTVGTTGTGQPFSTLNPYLAVTACISLTGLFPSRN